jgi:hypothetical protein
VGSKKKTNLAGMEAVQSENMNVLFKGLEAAGCCARQRQLISPAIAVQAEID